MDGFATGYSAGFVSGLVLGMVSNDLFDFLGNREVRGVSIKAEVGSEEEGRNLDRELRALSEKYQLRRFVEGNGKSIEYKIGEIPV